MRGERHETPTWDRYAVALAVLRVGLIALGVPASTLLIGALVLACPLMMLTMHGGHGGHDQGAPDRTANRAVPAPENHDHHNHETTGRR